MSIALFTLLVGVYLLSYSGIYHSGDEIGYVRDAVEIVRDTSIQLGHSGPFALVLAAGLALIRDTRVVGALQTLFLVNIVSSALAAVFLLLLGLELGYDRRAALLVALLFGLATPAWVYSKLLFRDPFIALALIAMAYFLVRFRNRASFLALGLGILSGAIAIATRQATAIAAPFAFAYVVHALRSLRGATGAGSRISKQAVLAIVAVLLLVVGAVVVVAFLVYTQWLDRLLRFFEHGDALAGLLISPGRGLLFFAPVIVLALAGLYRFARQHPWEALLLYGPILFYLLMVSSYPMWWGGWNWGPRFLVSFLPFLIFPAIALIDPLITQRSRRWLLVPLAGIALLSFITQIVGAAVGPNTPSFENMFPSTFYEWTYTPLAYLPVINRLNPDLAWLHLSDGLGNQMTVIMPALAVIGFSILLLWLAITRPAGGAMLGAAVGMLVLTVGVAAWSMVQYQRLDVRYQFPAGYSPALKRVLEQAKPGDAIVYRHLISKDVHMFPSIVDNICGSKCPPTYEVARKEWEYKGIHAKVLWLDHLRSSADRVWLLAANPYYTADPITEVEPWLDSTLFKAGCELFREDTELCLYYNLTPSEELAAPFVSPSLIPDDQPPSVLLPTSEPDPGHAPETADLFGSTIVMDATFGEVMRLNDVRVHWRNSDPQASGGRVVTHPAEPVLIDLVWQAVTPMDARYKVSLQVLDGPGTVIHRIDREPVDGFLPTNTWHQDQFVSDRYALVLPPSLSAGNYELILVVYDPETGARLSVGPGDALKLTDLTVITQP